MKPLQPEKAVPPLKLSNLAPGEPGDPTAPLRVSCRVTFDRNNGGPLLALWLPVQRTAQALAYLPPQGGAPLPLPRPEQIDVSGLLPVDEADDDWVDLPELPWPAHAEEAMLVLLHPQTRDTVESLHGNGLQRWPIEPEADHRAYLQTCRLCIAAMVVDLQTGDLSMADHVVVSRPSPQPAAPVMARRGWAAGDGTEASVHPQAKGLVLAVASCAYPAQVFDVSAKGDTRTQDVRALMGPADRALYRLSQRFRQGGDGAPSLCVLTGDQVYADATAGLFDPGFLEDGLRFAYQRVDDSQGWRQLRSATGPAYALFDDHELRDNWAPPADPPDELSRAVRKYWQRQRRPHWPGGVPPTPPEPLALWADGVPNGHPIFLADTRSERQAARTPATLQQARIMGEAQWDALAAWIHQHGGPDQAPHFIASSSMVLPRRLAELTEPARAVCNDTWVGHPASLHSLLQALCAQQASNIVLLSGDEHMGMVAVIEVHDPDTNQHVRLLSVHAPALYAPFPFANSRTDLFPAADRFTLTDAAGQAPLELSVHTWCPPNEDGHVLVRTHPLGQGWAVSVSFELGDAAVHPWPASADGLFRLG